MLILYFGTYLFIINFRTFRLSAFVFWWKWIIFLTSVRILFKHAWWMATVLLQFIFKRMINNNCVFVTCRLKMASCFSVSIQSAFQLINVKWLSFIK